MDRQYTIDWKERQLIKIGASMAATNQDSFKEAFDELLSSSVEIEEIQFATAVGRTVREKPAAEMKKYTEKLFFVDPQAIDNGKGCPAEKMRDNTNYRLMMLVAAGSAVAGNCEPCLNQSVLALIDAGVHEGDIRVAAEIGLRVKERKVEDIREAAATLTGIDEERREACRA